MKRATFIIPKADNEGRKFPTRTVAELRREILERFQGYTVREVKGGWMEDGREYQDESWEYTVVMDDEGLEWLVSWLRKAREVLRQEAMFLEVVEAEAQLIR
ncbi:MAG: hypothetical protein QME79_12240 [Bacillota bacterium]|nr:hypothetical protein [Bacillota bacterium]